MVLFFICVLLGRADPIPCLDSTVELVLAVVVVCVNPKGLSVEEPGGRLPQILLRPRSKALNWPTPTSIPSMNCCSALGTNIGGIIEARGLYQTRKSSK